jgi:hypothetical protein
MQFGMRTKRHGRIASFGNIHWRPSFASDRRDPRVAPRNSKSRRTVMAGTRTREQQVKIIEERENTKNAGEDFDAKAELKKSAQEREAYRKGADLRTDAPNLVDPDDRDMLRGENQESQHHKKRADD